MIFKTRKCLKSYTSLWVTNLTQEQDMEPVHQIHWTYPWAALEPPHWEETLHEWLQCPLRTTPAPPLRQTLIPPPEVNSHWFTRKHTCATTKTSTSAKKDYSAQKSALTTATTSASACSSTKFVMVGRHGEPPHLICPQVTTQCQTMELSLSTDTLQAEETAKQTTLVNPLCVSDVAETAIQNITAKTAKFPADTARARCMPPIAVHSSQEPHQPQMVRHLTLLAPMDEASEHTCQIHSASRKRSPRTRRDKRGNIQRNPRPSKMTMVPTQQHTRWTEIHSHHHKGNNSISAHHSHNKYLSTVRLWSSRTPAWLLHSDRWLNYISNTLRQAKCRQKLLRTLPVPHPSHPQ